MAKAKKQVSPMEKLTAGYEEFIKNKQTNATGAAKFANAIKKAAKPRSTK